MNEKLNRNEYAAIAKEVTSQLQTLFPQVNPQIIQCVFGPEILAKPLRVSTLRTKVDFEEAEKKAVAHLRDEIKQEKDKTIRKQKLQQLESIILFGQLLFSQSACLYFLKDCEHLSKSPKITEKLASIHKLIEEEGIAKESSRFEALYRRKKFDGLFSEIQQYIRNEKDTNELGDVHDLQESLNKAKNFYYQTNDLNFKYAQKPSRSFSTFVNTLQDSGAKVALTATIIAIGAAALSFIPPLTPIMAPVALTSSHIALYVGLPIALKSLGTMLYNFCRFGAAPTTGELIGASLLGTSLLTAGLGSVASRLVTLGLTGEWAVQTANGLNTALQLTKTTFGITGQINQSVENCEVDQVNEHRLNLK